MDKLLGSGQSGLSILFHLVVHDEHDRPSQSTENVGKATFVEWRDTTLVGEDLLGAVEGPTVHSLGAGARLHHHAPADGVDWVGNNARQCFDRETNAESKNEMSLFRVIISYCLCSVVKTEESRAVNDNSNDRYRKALVETDDSIGLGNFFHAVKDAGKLPLRCAFSDIGAQSSTGEVQRVHEAHTSGSCCTACRQHSGEELPKVGFFVVTDENFLVFFFEGKVQCLRREVSDNIRHVTAPER